MGYPTGAPAHRRRYQDESILPARGDPVDGAGPNVSGVTWHHADVYGTGQSGFVPDSALRRINAQEAEYYKNRLQPKATDTPAPTRVPDQVSGYAITLGDNVPMRNYVDPNAQISRVLPANTIVSVRGQEYAMGTTWHLVQSGANYGFIRADQLRMLNAMESQAYIESLRQPTPTPMATLAPLTQNSLSSYGYVNADKVRLRKTPSTSAVTLKMMDKNAFALVLSSSQEADGLWYHINQGGTEGYVMGKYFTVLPINHCPVPAEPAYQSQHARGFQAARRCASPRWRISTPASGKTRRWPGSYEPFNFATSTAGEAILMPVCPRLRAALWWMKKRRPPSTRWLRLSPWAPMCPPRRPPASPAACWPWALWRCWAAAGTMPIVCIRRTSAAPPSGQLSADSRPASLGSSPA